MKKIAIVNQRYGLEVNGGSEYYTRLIAEHLNKRYEIEILTTTALNYDTWENYYPEGKAELNHVKVFRFPVKSPRNMLRFRVVSKSARLLSKAGIHLDKLWIKEQGPKTPLLIKYIKEHQEEYDCFIFVTYLYYTTALGLPEVADKSILIPTAHDEPYVHFRIFQRIFRNPKGIIFLTDEEKEFVHHKFYNAEIPNEVIGVGIDIPEKLKLKEYRSQQIVKFRREYGIASEYIIYVGRVDYGKKCDEMFAFFHNYKERYPESEIQLVVVGKDMMGIPQNTDIHYLGFVSEDTKYAAIAGARFLWLPSQFESLSIALLEGMALSVPGIVNGNCMVLKGHCTKSQGAVFYRDENELMQRLQELCSLSEQQYGRLAANAFAYVTDNYRWHKVEERFVQFIELIIGKDS